SGRKPFRGLPAGGRRRGRSSEESEASPPPITLRLGMGFEAGGRKRTGPPESVPLGRTRVMRLVFRSAPGGPTRSLAAGAALFLLGYACGGGTGAADAAGTLFEFGGAVLSELLGQAGSPPITTPFG